MPEYKNLDGAVLDNMEEALKLAVFTLTWVDAEVKCTRFGDDDVWSLERKMKDGLPHSQGSVSRLPSFAFVRSGSGVHEYSTFDEAAREQIKPISSGF